MSSFLPNIVVTQAVNDLGLKVNLDKAAVQEKIRAGLDRLYNFQHEDGGWGWWETDESHPFMTAYVVAGLAQAKAAGVQVDAGPDRERQEVDCERRSRADPKLASDLRAYMQYALAVAGGADAAGLGQVYDQRAKLSPYGLAILGLALETGEGCPRGGDRGRTGAGGAAGCRAGMVAGDARPDARFLGRRHARSDGIRGEVPLASASRIPRCCPRRRCG